MDDQRRNLILAIILSVAVLFGWQIFVDGPAQQRRVAEQEARAAEEAAQQELIADATQTGAVAPGGATAAAPAAAVVEDVRVPFTASELRGTLNLTGARIDDVTLVNYREEVDPDSPNIHYLKPLSDEGSFFTDFGWVSADVEVPTVNTAWTLTAQKGARETLQWENGTGQTFEIVYDFGAGDFLVDVDQRVINNGDKAVTVRPFGRVLRYDRPATTGFFILHEGPIGFFSDDALEELDYGDLEDQDYTFKSRGGWAGITDKYWLNALLPDQSRDIEVTYSHGRTAGRDYYSVLYNDEPVTVGIGAETTLSSHAFIGAKEVALLDQYGDDFGLPSFDKAVDFGWFYFLTKPFFLALSWLNSLVGNFGVAILLLTVGVKLLLFPLANAGYRSTSKMKLLQPKMVELRERHGDDRQALNQDMMKLYKEEGVNPLGGCLPIVVQIPVFFALYKVLFVSIEMRHAPFFGWIQDLSAPDPTSILNLFGLLPWAPVPVAILSIVAIGIWPILMGLSMFAQQRLNPAPADPIQARVFMLLPIVFTFLLATFSAGLVIYWTWNNLLSIAQQWLIMRNTKLETVKVKTDKKSQKKQPERVLTDRPVKKDSASEEES